jgi:hypothetical protein
LLDSLDSYGGDTRVHLESRDLGALEMLQLRWWSSRNRIRLSIRTPEGHMDLHVTSVRQIGDRLEIRVQDGRQPVPQILAVEPASAALGHRVPGLWQFVRRWLNENWPGCRVVIVSRRVDRWHSLSGNYLRVLFRHGGRHCVLLASDPRQDGGDAHAALAQALLWVQQVASRNLPEPPEIILLLPSGSATVAHHCARLLSPKTVKLEVWNYKGLRNEEDVHRTRNPPPPVENRDFRWPVLGPFRWSPQLSRVLDLAPRYIRRYPRFQEYDSLRLWGLEFARACGEDREYITFGIGSQQTELTEENFEALRMLVGEILYFRRPDCPSTEHPYFRAQSERWLESLILDSADRLFPELVQQSVYSQIPVYVGKDPGRVDILAVDREGTLVVMELKVAASPNLPLQALDYWGRVVLHNNLGDFERRGYFAETRLNRNRPRIYLVAPVFSFHDSTETILRYFDPAVQVWKIAVNEDWRCGVRVLSRTLVTGKSDWP